jgi:hypothetical protein
MSLNHLYLLAVAAIVGCSSASSTSGTPGTSVPRRSNVLTAEEIVAANADAATAHDALVRLRPQWLSSHGPTSFITQGTEFAIVFVDGHRYGDLSSLRNIPASEVGDIRYYNSAEAGGKFGLRAGTGGVIEVRMNLRVPSRSPN